MGSKKGQLVPCIAGVPAPWQSVSVPLVHFEHPARDVVTLEEVQEYDQQAVLSE